ncbi:MAG TPA: 6-phosphogluconolactonase, partial [Thermoanaerobaculia bacterium]|nr:6-phosphogluconolactonase [Thermoanaerobaculia bacterium]
MEEQRVSDGGGGRGGAGGGPRRREVRVLEDAVELTRAAAAEVTAALALHRDAWLPGAAAAGTAAAPFPGIALAGGSTPRALYRLLADPAAPFRARIDWQAVHFFWGDERHVPPDHPDSNYRMAREAMLDHVQVPAAHVHRIAGEEPDAARAARLYERELIEVFGLRRDRGNGKDATGGESATSGESAAGDADADSGTAGDAAR